jgi:hypothetical protein
MPCLSGFFFSCRLPFARLEIAQEVVKSQTGKGYY